MRRPRADDLYWASLVGIDGDPTEEGAKRQRDVAQSLYKAATLRALARGFTYASAEDLAARADVADLVARFRSVDEKDRSSKSIAEKAEAEAVLGGVAPPPLLVSEAFEIYCNEI
ncbi:MAG: integrase, partial [Pseudomonadota bacterium]